VLWQSLQCIIGLYALPMAPLVPMTICRAACVLLSKVMLSPSVGLCRVLYCLGLLLSIVGTGGYAHSAIYMLVIDQTSPSTSLQCWASCYRNTVRN
jgi:hypothetical protein